MVVERPRGGAPAPAAGLLLLPHLLVSLPWTRATPPQFPTTTTTPEPQSSEPNFEMSDDADETDSHSALKWKPHFPPFYFYRIYDKSFRNLSRISQKTRHEGARKHTSGMFA